jgi:hypothetical protein
MEDTQGRVRREAGRVKNQNDLAVAEARSGERVNDLAQGEALAPSRE